MGIDLLRDVVHSANQDSWESRNMDAFHALFGGVTGRYPKAAQSTVTLRAPPRINQDSGVPFAAYIHPSNPSHGAYSGLSFAIFPVPDQPALITLATGTQGLAPDEAILGRPGHARKVQAICSWLNQEYGKGEVVAWCKHDPTRTELPVPKSIQEIQSAAYKSVFEKYGKEIYALFVPSKDQELTSTVLNAFLDLLFEERDHSPMAGSRKDAESIQKSWFEYLMPSVEPSQVKDLLINRRYVILQGPPGTGKTKMAVDLVKEQYCGFGRSIQFHPNTTYESFIGGLAPVQSSSELGLRFSPSPGFLMEAARKAAEDPSQNYLLHIDEINRADLGKILGEAIFLLESSSAADRRIELAYDFGAPFHRLLHLPKNLHILGTMNSADRSIAIVDVAVRRRFAFVSLWPRMSVVEKFGCELMQEQFKRLVSLFVEHASDDSFPLMPGHSYFLELNVDRARESLKVNLAPLLEEYLAQGYVSGFAEPIRSYLQGLRSL